MTLQEQKNIFLRTPKGIKAVTYARKWFDDFVNSKLEPNYLQIFYASEKYNNFVPVEAEKDFNDYELMFWFWFYERYRRVLNEQQIGLDIKRYEAEMREIEAANPLNWFGWLPGLIKYAPYVAIGGLVLYGIRTFKK